MREVLGLCNEAVSEKTPQLSLPDEFVTLISIQTDTPEVRCGLTDGVTHRQTNPTTVTLAAHARRGLMMKYGEIQNMSLVLFVH